MQTGNGRFLDELGHGIRDPDFLAVEADDEAGVHEHPGAVNLVDALGDIAPGILLLLHAQGSPGPDFRCRRKRRRSWPRPSCQKFLIIGEIDRGFCRKLERIAVLALPVDEFGQKA